MSPRVLAVLVLASLGASAQRPAPEVLVAVGHPVPGMPGTEVLTVGVPAVNGPGAWAVSLVFDDGLGGQASALFGGGPGEGGAVLRTPATFDDLRQDALGPVALDDAGRLLYTAVVTDLGGGGSGLQSLWLDDVPLGVEGEPSPVPGQDWQNFRWIKMTRGGRPHWTSWYTVNGGPVPAGEGAFFGTAPTLDYKSGDLLPNLPSILLNNPFVANVVKSSYRYSAHAVHSIAGVSTNPGGHTYVVVDGEGFVVEGRLLGPNVTLPPSWALTPNERWDALGFHLGITDDGTYMVWGNTNGPSLADDLLVIDGTVLIREGDAVDGRRLQSQLRRSVLTEEQDVAFLWRFVDDDSVVNPHGLFVNGRLVLRDDDPLDMDGDGVDDAVVGELWSTGHAMDPDRNVYVNADVEGGGIDLALLRVPAGDMLVSEEGLSVSAGGELSVALLAPRDVPGSHYALVTSISAAPASAPSTFALPGGPLTLAGAAVAPGPGFTLRTGRLDGLDTARETLVLPAGGPGALAGQVLTLWYAKLRRDGQGGLVATAISDVHVVPLLP